MAGNLLSPGRDAECVAALEDHIEAQRTTLYDAQALIRASQAALRWEEADPNVVARTLRIAATMLETARKSAVARAAEVAVHDEIGRGVPN